MWAWHKRSGWPVLLALLAITALDDARAEVLTIYYAYDVLPEDAPANETGAFALLWDAFLV